MALARGEHRVGWKLGIGERERIGSEPLAIGHLTSATCLDPGSTFDASPVVSLHADAEVFVDIGRDVAAAAGPAAAREAISGYGAALELVDLGPPDDPLQIVAANVFHRAVALGEPHRRMPEERVEGRLIVNGDVVAVARAPADYAERVHALATLLEAMGEALRAGDRVITGSVVQAPIRAGDEVVADLGALGRVPLTIVS
jgi:2-keto-4-pentenoate hydratase